MSSSTSPPNHDEQTPFSVALAALLDIDRSFRVLTHDSLQRIDAAVAMGDPNSLILQGIQRWRFKDEGYGYFAQAEAKGADHPVLYYFLGWGYEYGIGVKQCLEIAMSYYMQGIHGGCVFSLLSVCKMVARQRRRKAYAIDEMMRQGVIIDFARDTTLPLWHCPKPGQNENVGGDDIDNLALEVQSIWQNRANERVIYGVLTDLYFTHQKDQTTRSFRTLLGPAKSYGEATDFLLKTLLRKKSPYAFHAMVKMSMFDGKYLSPGRVLRRRKEIELLEEADRQGLADVDIYSKLGIYFMEANSPDSNGLLALHYLQKGLQVANCGSDVYMIYVDIIRLYEMGCSPIEIDLQKANNLRNEAVKHLHLYGD